MPLILWISTIFGENDNSEIYRSECKYGEIGGEREKDTLNDEILISDPLILGIENTKNIETFRWQTLEYQKKKKNLD